MALFNTNKLFGVVKNLIMIWEFLEKGWRYILHGNFCSHNVAAAYIFDENDNTNELWERYSLLNFLYGSNNEK